MKFILTFLLSVCFHLLYAQSADEKALIATEKERFNAQITRDPNVLDKVLADDLVYTHSSGQVDSKQSFIQSIKEAKMVYEQINVEEQKVRIYGRIAVVNGVCTIKAINNGQPMNLKLRYTDAYKRKGKQWQLITWQSLRI
ncbi:nuclear transport factor 2 family protein [Arsenicibacter rosenii]|uniref:DUF4440 domain-containing protein n=1 Tax=Arsenicibacter rosenii TaxID=1750698 RepID=A0A1S2VMC3_9BACT|nr:nuclear transport factor 2 family protein [Arsenicibacter rosenii]OIN59913.1 DUF4440 domain-containing protein [Arsenicibacter rosenii]